MPGRSTLAALAIAASASGLGCGAPVDTTPVVLVSIDTLRADGVGSYGNPHDTTPALDALAADGVLFEQFFHSGGGTLPSHVSMLTSLNPAVHGIENDAGRALDPERVTLAEQLRDAGYATAAFTDGGWMRARFGFDQGFDTFDESGGRLVKILPKALDWIDAHRREDFFLFLHTYDAHSEWRALPYDCPGGFPATFVEHPPADFDGCHDGKCASTLFSEWNGLLRQGMRQPDAVLTPEDLAFVRALYDGCIRYVDSQLARLVAHLKERGLYEKSLIVATSDHGEEFLEHGLLLHGQEGYDEIAHIPLVLKLPADRGIRGVRVPYPAAMIDLFPTVLDVLGIEANPQAQGVSLLRSVLEERPVRADVAFRNVLRTPRYKYFGGKKRLYDLEADPAERENLYEAQPELARALARKLGVHRRFDRDHRRAYPVHSESLEVRLTPAEREELEALGYLR